MPELEVVSEEARLDFLPTSQPYRKVESWSLTLKQMGLTGEQIIQLGTLLQLAHITTAVTITQYDTTAGRILMLTQYLDGSVLGRPTLIFISSDTTSNSICILPPTMGFALRVE